MMELTPELALCASHDLERGRKNIDEFILHQTLQDVSTATRQPIILYMKNIVSLKIVLKRI